MHSRKRIFLVACILFTGIAPIAGQQRAKNIVSTVSPDSSIGFLEFRPANYGKELHPLIIFLHGRDERGNGFSAVHKVAANGIPKLCAKGATMRFLHNGTASSFVVLSPQLHQRYGAWPVFYVAEMIAYAKANLHIDTNRIYLTGMSLGGGGVWAAISDNPALTDAMAAAAPVCGTSELNDNNFRAFTAPAQLPIWAFHSMDDKTVPVQNTEHAEVLGNICRLSPPMKITYYKNGGHASAWLNAYDTGHKTFIVKGGGKYIAKPNLYEWLLSNARNNRPGNAAAK
jgi:predicted peptidase